MLGANLMSCKKSMHVLKNSWAKSVQVWLNSVKPGLSSFRLTKYDRNYMKQDDVTQQKWLLCVPSAFQ